MIEKKKKVLLDTNVLIKLEDTNRELSDLLARIKRLCSENNVLLYIHPAQIKYDIENDSNTARKKLLQQRLKQYSTLDIKYSPISASGKTNDQVDQLLLDAVSCGSVHYLISEDIGLHKKAKKKKVSEPVFYIRQFQRWLEREFCASTEPLPPYDLQEEFLYNIDLKSDFFDSLRDSYPKFDEWYKRVSGEHRKAWLVYTDSQKQHVGAVCIYKSEGKGENKKLKLCTFKVKEDLQGQKIGERLLYHSFRYAESQEISEVYIEIQPVQKHLISLCEEYGFRCGGKKNDQVDDNVYFKQMTPPDQSESQLANFEYCVRFFPHYRDTDDVQKYLIPIRPEFHQRLFPDTNVGYLPGLEPPVRSEGRAIKKAYICHANIRCMRQGDVMLFYQSEKQTIAVCAIVEQTHTVASGNTGELQRFVSKRTVYSVKELQTLNGKECLVILFRLIRTIEYPIGLPKEISTPQSICRLDKKLYAKYFKEKFNHA